MLSHIDSHYENNKIEITLKHSADIPNSTLLYLKALIQTAISNSNSTSQIIKNDYFDETSSEFSERNYNNDVSNLFPLFSENHSVQQLAIKKTRGRGRPSKSHKEPMDLEQFDNASPEKRKYLELRYRNNLACRLARKKRKQLESEIFSEEVNEIQRNEKLKAEFKKYEFQQVTLFNYLEKVKNRSHADNSYEKIHSFKMFKMKAHKVIGSHLQGNQNWISQLTKNEITSH